MKGSIVGLYESQKAMVIGVACSIACAIKGEWVGVPVFLAIAAGGFLYTRFVKRRSTHR